MGSGVWVRANRSDIAQRWGQDDDLLSAEKLIDCLASAGQFHAQHVAVLLPEKLAGQNKVRMVGTPWVNDA